jgi:DNA-binding FadR family transcriptional regulator
MTYTASQIENAKRNYFNFLQIRTVASFEPEFIGYAAAEQRCQYHNDIVNAILSGDKAKEAYWKTWYLNEQVKADKAIEAKKEKLNANKEASADILAPIKAAKKMGAFGEWLNTKGNPFRNQHFSKKYTQESIKTFLSL